ncbi:CBN-AGE-1 protein [Caenorhabditis brenneri]|uniref:CBN-AGE-1 protein n=1 Tax=Caenorhabditis brenneri TaxID=135651 RepID=G0MV70_CAEBE|nr:CBN-AGE-1 protein [Caenorhabditis brenneri]
MHVNILHPQLQTMVEQWQMRERPSLETENGKGSLLLETDGVADELTLCPFGEVISVVFPWFLANVRASLDMKLSDFKHQLFEQIAPMKWAGYSTKPQDYVFRQLNNFGEIEVIFNDDQPLSKFELHGTFPMLFLFQPDGINRDKELMSDISHCLGYSLDRLEESLDEELRQFRASLWSRTKKTCLARGQEGTSHYAFPEEQFLCVSEQCPKDLDSKAKAAKLYYQLYWRKKKAEQTKSIEKMYKVVIDFDCDETPYTLLIKFEIEARRLLMIDSEDHPDEKYILQLAGRTTYITNLDVKLTSYDGVRSELESYRCPGFVICRESIVLSDYQRPKPLYEPHYVRAHERKMALDVLSVSIDSAPKQNKNSDKVMTDFRPTASLRQVSLWDLDANLMIRPVSVTGFEFPAETELYVRMDFTVYVGTLTLASKSTTKVNALHGKWNKDMYTFDLYMKDMPPSAVLSVRVYYGKVRLNSEETEIGWVNMSLTDWRDELRQGQFVFNLWAPEPSANRSRIGENGAKIGTAAAVTIEISSYGGRVRMPSQGQYTYLVDHRVSWTETVNIVGDDYEACIKDPGYKRLQKLVKKHEEGIELSEDEQRHVWSWRRYIQKQEPDLLIILSELKFVWTDRENFSELYVMLEKWKPPSVAAALTLLGKRCTDRVIRKFAVEKLNEQLSSVTFHLFLLPLVQALKYEPRAQSEVGMMLLTRALSDYRIGHRLFWLLRAEIARLRDCEMKSEEYRRISLLMEAYLRGNEEHIKVIIRQVDMVDELTRISSLVKGLPKEAATMRLRDELEAISHKMEDMDSPLDPVYKLGKLHYDKAIVLGSAKQPLLLSWDNANPKSDLHREHCAMIFKNGDDLRQDMLVLQVLEVMDNIWKAANIDCCLSPYGVLPMGEMIGIIEVVPKCKTIFEIQIGSGFMNTAVRSIDSKFMNKWIREQCGLEDEKKKKKDEKKGGTKKVDTAQATKRYFESVDRFLYSCVGYSVATYIMGIKDRHSDNLMLTEDGKYFHIDFGHILGHGKTKLGIQRDRQPFILTEHFLTVIRSGKSVESNSHEIQKFKTLCIEAYEVMWNNRDLFVSLFTLMLGMELPELSTKEDLDHLKKTLHCKGETKEEARKFFSDVYEEAFNGSWSTKTNWLFHAVKHY